MVYSLLNETLKLLFEFHPVWLNQTQFKMVAQLNKNQNKAFNVRSSGYHLIYVLCIIIGFYCCTLICASLFTCERVNLLPARLWYLLGLSNWRSSHRILHSIPASSFSSFSFLMKAKKLRIVKLTYFLTGIRSGGGKLDSFWDNNGLQQHQMRLNGRKSKFMV